MAKLKEVSHHGYVVTSPGCSFSEVVVVGNNYDRSLGGYKMLFDVIQRRIRTASIDEAMCGAVTKSSQCCACPCVRIACDRGITIDGFISVEKLHFGIDV